MIPNIMDHIFEIPYPISHITEVASRISYLTSHIPHLASRITKIFTKSINKKQRGRRVKIIGGFVLIDDCRACHIKIDIN